MSERNPNYKRDAREFEASNPSVSPLKKKKKNFDHHSTTDSHVSSPPSSSSSLDSSADSVPGRCSVTSVGEDDEQSSSILCSGRFSTESNEITRNAPACVVDLEAHQISETETSTLITSNFRKEGNSEHEALGETTTERDKRRKSPEVSKKRPTSAEIEGFLSELENDEKQKRFIEKYNFDIVNDKPLEGRYKWDLIKP